VSGVGLGADLWLLAAKNQGWYRVPPSKVKELDEIIPDIGSAIADAWNGKITLPKWLIDLFT
jgi:hypothetical protein